MTGIIKYRQKKYSIATKYLNSSLEINQALFQDKFHMNIARLYYGLGFCELYAENKVEGERLF